MNPMQSFLGLPGNTQQGSIAPTAPGAVRSSPNGSGLMAAAASQNTGMGAQPTLSQLAARPGANMFGNIFPGNGVTPGMNTQNANAQGVAGMGGAFMGMGGAGAPNAGTPNTGMISQIMSQLHPQASDALRAIPRETMAHVTQAGLMHPGVMQHFHGAQQ
jgi:hypothetical protein